MIIAIFSLNPDSGQNKQDKYFIFVITYFAYIPFSRPTIFCPLPQQIFEKKKTRSCQDPGATDPQSERIFDLFQGAKITQPKKTPDI